MAGFWGKRKREEQEALEAQDADLARRARTALVAADERIRLTTDELAFAEAELGVEATRELREALTSVRHAPRARRSTSTSSTTTRSRTPPRSCAPATRASCSCASGPRSCSTTAPAALAEPIATRAARARDPRRECRADAARLRGRLPHARDTVARLAARYSAEALKQIDENPDEAEQLLGFAEHSAAVAERRREAGQREQANLALETATEAVRRAVDAHRRRRDLRDRGAARRVDARRRRRGLPRRPRRGPHRAAGPRRRRRDGRARGGARRRSRRPASTPTRSPQLTRLREANGGLDAAIAAARERAARPSRPSTTCVTRSTTPTGSSPSRAT